MRLALESLRGLFRRIKYPKFLLLILTYVAAYVLFSHHSFRALRQGILGLGFFGAFLTGVLYVYSFTSAIGTAILLSEGHKANPFLTAAIAAAGSMIGDLIFLKLLRTSFSDEVERLRESKPVVFLKGKLPRAVKKALIYVLGWIFIASPLPDELGVTLLAVSPTPSKVFMALCYLANGLGMLVVLLLA